MTVSDMGLDGPGLLADSIAGKFAFPRLVFLLR